MSATAPSASGNSSAQEVLLAGGPREGAGAELRARYAREIAEVTATTTPPLTEEDLLRHLERYEGVEAFIRLSEEHITRLAENPSVLKRFALACIKRELIGGSEAGFRHIDYVIEVARLSDEDLQPIAEQSLAIVRSAGVDERWKRSVITMIITQFPRLQLGSV